MIPAPELMGPVEHWYLISNSISWPRGNLDLVCYPDVGIVIAFALMGQVRKWGTTWKISNLTEGSCNKYIWRRGSMMLSKVKTLWYIVSGRLRCGTNLKDSGGYLRGTVVIWNIVIFEVKSVWKVCGWWLGGSFSFGVVLSVSKIDLLPQYSLFSDFMNHRNILFYFIGRGFLGILCIRLRLGGRSLASLANGVRFSIPLFIRILKNPDGTWESLPGCLNCFHFWSTALPNPNGCFSLNRLPSFFSP